MPRHQKGGWRELLSKRSLPHRGRRSTPPRRTKPEQNLLYGWTLDDACGDAYVQQQIHDRALAQRLDEDQDRLRAHVALLDAHEELHDDLARCRADLGALPAEWDERIEAATSSRAKRAAQHERDRALDQLVACTLLWLWRCYEGVWAELRDYFVLPDFLIVGVIQKAIMGTWHDAASELRRIPRIVLAGEASHLQYQALIAQVVVSDLPPEACAQIIASIGAAQVGQAKPPGGRPKGRRSEHDVRMELYQKWRAWPPGRGAIAAFIRAVADKQVRIDCWGDAPPSEEGITSHLRKAREWLAPRRDTVPATPRAYLPPMGE